MGRNGSRGGRGASFFDFWESPNFESPRKCAGCRSNKQFFNGRRAAGIKADDQLIAETTPDGILLRRAVTLAVEIYSDDRIRGFHREEDKQAKVLAKRTTR
jgi:hypothetical protein